MPGPRRAGLPPGRRGPDPQRPGDRPRQARLPGHRRRRMAPRQPRRHHRPAGRRGDRPGARRVRAGSSSGRRLASRERAQELATTAAERVYRSDAIKKAIEGLAAGVGKEIGKRIELAVLDTAGPATQCMQAFLGRRYGATVAGVVSSDAGKEYSIDPSKARRAGDHRPGLVGRQRRHCRHRGAGGAAAALQHGRAHRPARHRLDPEPPRVGGGGRHRPGADRQGHLGFPPRGAADRRHRDESEGHQGQGARGDRQDHLRAHRRKPQGNLRQDGRARGGDLARVPPRPRQGAGVRRSQRGVQALPGYDPARPTCRASTRSWRWCWPARARPA